MPKHLSSAGVRARTHHDAFVWMMFACVNDQREEPAFDAAEILGYWWLLAFGRELEESDIDEGTFDAIRSQLLLRGHGYAVALRETHITQRVKQELVFED